MGPRLRLVAVLAPALLLACGGEDAPDAGDALKTFEAFQGHLRARDWGAVYDCTCAADHRKVEAKVESIREVLSGRKNDPELRKKYERMAEAFGVSVSDLQTLEPREYAVLATETKLRGTDGLVGILKFADAEVAKPPNLDGHRCAITVRLADGRAAVVWLVSEEGRWRVSLGGEPPR